MFAVLAEDHSDADALVVLVKRIAGQQNMKVAKKGFGGCGELRRKAGSHIVDFSRQGVTHFIICHDSDGKDPAAVRETVKKALQAKLDLEQFKHKIVVPVQELEAWIIADEAAITSAIPSLIIGEVRHPETVPSPKEWLVKESQRGRSRPLYAPATFNLKVASFLDLSKVEQKCQSFRELVAFVRAEHRNQETSSG